MHTQSNKLDQRFLRSRINKIISNQGSICNRLHKTQSIQTKDEINQRKMIQSIQKQLIQQTDFTSRQMVFTPYRANQFVPTSNQSYEPPPLYEKVRPQTIHEVQRLIQAKISVEDLIQVSEDPIYFIKNPQVRELDFLQTMQVGNKVKFKGNNNQRIAPDSHLLKPRLLTARTNYSKPQELTLILLQQSFIARNQQRKDQFQVSRVRSDEQDESNRLKLLQRLKLKKSNADERQIAIQESKQRTTQNNQQSDMDRISKLKLSRMIQAEDYQVEQLSQQLRKVCVERNISKQREKGINMKLLSHKPQF